MKVKKQTDTEYVIQERTSLKGNPRDICNLNISFDLYKDIKESLQVAIVVVKIIYDNTSDKFIQVTLEYDKESFLSLKTVAGKVKGKSIRLNLNSKELFDIKRIKSIDLNNFIKRSFKSLNEIKNSVQKRAISGYKFEREICENKGWIPESASPSLYWEGNGKSWIDKLKSVDFNVEAFRVNLNKSKFKKWDATDELGNKYEIKDYDIEKIRGRYILYSEPIIKIAPSSSKWKQGNKQYDVFPSPVKYNQFINDLMNSSWWKRDSTKILNKIINSSKGIQFQDDIFIKKNDIDFFWKLKSGWNGYKRLSIVFKV